MTPNPAVAPASKMGVLSVRAFNSITLAQKVVLHRQF